MTTSWEVTLPAPQPFEPGLPVMTVTLSADTDDPEIIEAIETAAANQGVQMERVP